MNILNVGSDMASIISKWTSVFLTAVAAVILLPVFKSIRRDDDSFVIWFAAMTFMTLYIAPVVWLTHFMLMVYPLFTLLFKLSKKHLKIAGVLSMGAAGTIYSAGQFLNSRETLQIKARAFGWPYWMLTLVLVTFVVFQAKQLTKERSSI